MEIPNKDHCNINMYFFSEIIFTEIIFNLLIKIFRFQLMINTDSDGNSSNIIVILPQDVYTYFNISLNFHPIAFKFSGYIVNNNTFSNTDEMILLLSVTSYSLFFCFFLIFMVTLFIFIRNFLLKIYKNDNCIAFLYQPVPVCFV